jgi:pimeloyl-ACP methyl ester carboxylesterase
LTKEAAHTGADHFKENGIDITGYNTLQSAADLEDLRQAVGAGKINLLAFSYGTHLALATAKRYPERIASMVLLGPSGLNHLHHLPSTYDKQLAKIAHLAAKDSAVNREVPDMLQLLNSVLDKLKEAPILVNIRDYKEKQTISVPIGKFGLQFILRLDAGDSEDFVYFPALLYGIDKGDYRLLQKYAERRFNQYNNGYGSGIFAVRQASGATPERYERIVREGKTALLGNAMNTPDLYAGYEKVDLGEEFRYAFSSDIPTLFISGTLDSNTPSSNVEEINKGFTRAFHIVVENAAHEDLLPSKAVQATIMSFMKNKTASNSNITLPVPKFISIY